MGHTSSDSLLRLPAEVRLRIYHHLFLGQNIYIDERCSFQLGNTLVARPAPEGLLKKETTLRWLRSILFTCRTCHQEAEPVLYSLLRINVRDFWIDTSSVLTAVPTRHMLDRIETISVRSSNIEFKHFEIQSYLLRIRRVCIFLRKDLQSRNVPALPSDPGFVRSSKGARRIHTWTPLVRAGRVDEKERRSVSCDILGESLKTRRRSGDFLKGLLFLRASSKLCPKYKVYVRDEWQTYGGNGETEVDDMTPN